VRRLRGARAEVSDRSATVRADLLEPLSDGPRPHDPRQLMAADSQATSALPQTTLAVTKPGPGKEPPQRGVVIIDGHRPVRIGTPQRPSAQAIARRALQLHADRASTPPPPRDETTTGTPGPCNAKVLRGGVSKPCGLPGRDGRCWYHRAP